MTNPFGAEAAELEQLHGQIREGEAAIRALKEALGDAYYRLHGNEESCELAEYCRQIRCREEDVNALSERIHAIENQPRCPVCGAVREENALFCSKCGTRLSGDAPEAPAVTKFWCKCGQSIPTEALFCPYCGGRNEPIEE